MIMTSLGSLMYLLFQTLTVKSFSKLALTSDELNSSYRLESTDDLLYKSYWPFLKTRPPHRIQSPVNIITSNATQVMLPPFQHVGYWGDDEILVNVTNNGHTVYVSLTNDEQNIPIGVTGGPLFDDLYMFDQLHLHWGEHDEGSEHKFNGQSYAMEIHLVHHKIDYGTFNEALKYCDGLCVVSYFGEISEEDDEEMTNFINDLHYLIEPGSSVVRLIGEEFFWLKKTADQIDYFAYPGSLTTEPYAESVTWMAFTIPFKISRKQLAKFRNLRSHDSDVLINKNDRELQEFNNRPIVYV